MSTLILQLPNAPAGPSCLYAYTLTVDGHAVAQHGLAPLEQLPPRGRAGAEVVAVVPVQALSWHWVELPAGTATTPQTPRLRAVLEGLLEDRLLDEPSQLHFALSPDARGSTAFWVAACDRPWLRQHLAALEATGRPVSRIVPELAPGTASDTTPALWALGTPEDPWLVATAQGPHSGLTCLPLSSQAFALALAGRPQAGGSGNEPEAVTLRAEPSVAALAEKTHGHPVTLQTPAQRAVDAARGHWDLAQFDLASRHRTRALRKAGAWINTFVYAPPWRAARWALLALILVQVVALNAVAWQERAALQAKEAGIRQALTQTFPQVKVVIDAPVQMARELALLQQTTGSVSPRDFEPLLSAIGTALPAGQTPSEVSFSSGELRLQGIALDATQLQEVGARLQALNLLAQRQGDALVVRPTAP